MFLLLFFFPLLLLLDEDLNGNVNPTALVEFTYYAALQHHRRFSWLVDPHLVT
jgi:hypothetical protein